MPSAAESGLRDRYDGGRGWPKSILNSEGWQHKERNRQSPGYLSGLILDISVTLARIGLWSFWGPQLLCFLTSHLPSLSSCLSECSFSGSFID